MSRPTRCTPWLAAAALLWAFAPAALAAGPAPEPVLRIEATMHTATPKRIATDRDGRFAVTASDDKTVRVWDATSGGLLQVLRPPIDEGNEGKLFAVAITPDGESVAAAGWTGWKWHPHGSVYIFDRASGTLRQRLSGLPSAVNHLAFSPDGRWLAAALGGPHGVRVWDWRSPRPVPAQDKADAASYGLGWSADGRLAATSHDGRIRLYRAASAAGHRAA